MKEIQLGDASEYPVILVDTESSEVKLTGRCLPEETASIYREVEEHVNAFLENGNAVNFVLQLEYFNTVSSYMISKCLHMLEDCSKAGNDIKVAWRYHEEDENMKEVAEDFRALVQLPSFDISAY